MRIFHSAGLNQMGLSISSPKLQHPASILFSVNFLEMGCVLQFKQPDHPVVNLESKEASHEEKDHHQRCIDWRRYGPER
jgi:hypothetical protein